MRREPKLRLQSIRAGSIWKSSRSRAYHAILYNRNSSDAHWNAHVSVGDGALNHFNRAGIVDPVAHFVLIESSVRNGGSKMIETGVKMGQIHDEVNGNLIAGTCSREPYAFIESICSRDILSEAIAHHKA